MTLSCVATTLTTPLCDLVSQLVILLILLSPCWVLSFPCFIIRPLSYEVEVADSLNGVESASDSDTQSESTRHVLNNRLVKVIARFIHHCQCSFITIVPHARIQRNLRF